MQIEPRISLVFNGECDAAEVGAVVNRFGMPCGINCEERQIA